MNSRKKLHQIHAKRARRVRATISGTAQRPRLSVFKSNKFVYVQLIDDSAQKTIASVSTRSGDAKIKSSNSERVAKLGAAIAKKAEEKGIAGAIFDRGRYKYHGVIKSLVEEARKNGLKI